MPNEKSNAPTPQSIPIGKIHDLPGIPIINQPDKAYGGLTSSILINGVKEPVILRQREDGEYQLVTGYRRRHAAQLAKLTDLPALVYNMTEKEAVEYNAKANLPNSPAIPGKLVEQTAKDDKAVTEPKAAEAAPTAKTGKEETAAPPAAAKGKETAMKSAAEASTSKAEKAAASASEKTDATAKAEKQQTAVPAVNAETLKEEKSAEAAAKKEQAESPAPDQKTGNKGKPKETPDKKAAPTAKKETKAPAPKQEPETDTAVGPMGTAITKVLDPRLEKPTDKEKRDIPAPGDGEKFSILLHPAYLKKAADNIFSISEDTDDYKELYQSIKKNGINEPVIARFGKDGELEILSGQRRHFIAQKLNYPVPTIIQRMDDDDARILVADGNLHREKISTYDRSRALRMKADSMKRKAGRRTKGSTAVMATDEVLAQEMGMSTTTLNRYMKLSEATKDICELVDSGKIQVSIAYHIAFLPVKVQDHVRDLIDTNHKINNEIAETLKKEVKKGNLPYEKVRAIMDGEYPPKPAPAKPAPTTPPAAPTPAMSSTNIPASPDVNTKTPTVPDNVVPFKAASDATTPAAAAVPAAAAAPTAPATNEKSPEAAVDRENSYETKIVLKGDRLRKYFPDVTMTPLAIENSIYDALEERRQRQEKQKQKSEIFNKEKKGPVK